MSKYKRGDWVRVIDNGGAWNEFTVGEVCCVTDIRGDLLWFGERAMYPQRFEPWAPRVGERVKYKNPEYGNATVISAVDFGSYVKVDTHGEFGICTESVSSIEPLLDKLTIQAGRYYKTRAGRKVGPMKTWTNTDVDVYQDRICEVAGDGRYWMLDGSDGTARGNDLIAEWPADATNVAATVDAQSEEYGPVIAADVAAAATKPKFKVGDRVRHKSLGYVGSVTKLINATTVKTHWPDMGWGGFDPAEDLELVTATPTNYTPAIVCLIENGQPLPASRPYVHTTTESAATEAKRMAGIHKGQEFGVFALTGTPHKVAKTYEHEWQRLAANGLDESAASELSKMTGLSWEVAHLAVRAA